ncbi:NAD(P)/FAD-dependent oxidoreductase [Microvirga sp. HBU67558]|uniref:NAD(P)/FAD-dependent oxidoreductase n=1 Tax=Microvirga TaxID=186650 RepID=UPI001B3922D9|nr:MULTISPECIES: NAD(P)/FAD-dependent oxidoreductase [unclassified Microvirga]MBQ0822032.1 NAD(P)/FAD-dependent oxidoreductase [Microvirga sp. HBU67558]
MNEVSHTGRPRVVIVGAGFGGLTVAKALADTPVDVTVIDQRNHHVFQPLLYQVATAALSPADIASPIRTILKGQRNTSVMLAKATGIDTDSGEVVAGDRRIPFDYLVLATGARHAYFGHDDWEAFAKGIKTIDDATGLRRRILLAFEKAEFETDPEERSRLLTFVVVGGGATGVEMAGAIAELAREALAADFRSIDPTHARIVLVEAGPRLLPVFEEHLSEAARCSLEELGVEVRVSTAVTGCDDAGVLLGDQRIGTRAILWAAGVQASLAGRWLGAETDRAGRVRVAPDLSVPGHPQIFVIGDTAHVLDMDGKPLPGVAPVAKQEGKYLAKLIRTRVAGGDLPPFRYRDPGALVTIGRKRAVVQFRRLRLSGYLAWWLWSLAHIYFLIGFRNRLVVAMNWAWTYVSLQRGTRLITGSDPGLDQVASETAITKPHLKGVA